MVIRSPGSPLIHSTRAVERQWVIVQPSHVALQWSSASRSGSSHANPAHPVPADWSPALQEPERPVVGRLGATHAPVEAADGLDVVVEDLGPRVEDGAERLLLDAEEVRREHLDGGVRELCL